MSIWILSASDFFLEEWGIDDIHSHCMVITSRRKYAGFARMPCDGIHESCWLRPRELFVTLQLFNQTATSSTPDVNVGV